jgi:hypothetical protein
LENHIASKRHLITKLFKYLTLRKEMHQIYSSPEHCVPLFFNSVISIGTCALKVGVGGLEIDSVTDGVASIRTNT